MSLTLIDFMWENLLRKECAGQPVLIYFNFRIYSFAFGEIGIFQVMFSYKVFPFRSYSCRITATVDKSLTEENESAPRWRNSSLLICKKRKKENGFIILMLGRPSPVWLWLHKQTSREISGIKRSGISTRYCSGPYRPSFQP